MSFERLSPLLLSALCFGCSSTSSSAQPGGDASATDVATQDDVAAGDSPGGDASTGLDAGDSSVGRDASDDGTASDAADASDSGAAPDASDASDSGTASDASDASVQRGCPAGSVGCYTVYASTDHVLFYLDRVAVQLVEVGPFHAPATGDAGVEDVITDLAVTPDGKLWAISHANLYLADETSGQVTIVGAVAACGTGNVALTSDLTGTLYTADFSGAICRVDPTTSPPTVTPVGSLGGNLAVAGDLVTVSDGTTFGTLYNPASPQSATNNSLATLTLSSPGGVQAIGPTGFPKLFGVGYGGGKVLAFSHDGTGHLIAIDPTTAVGQLVGQLTDPTTGGPALIGGAGVDPRVSRTGL